MGPFDLFNEIEEDAFDHLKKDGDRKEAFMLSVAISMKRLADIFEKLADRALEEAR